MSVLSLWSQQTCLVASFQAIETSLSQLPWRVSGAALRGCDHYFQLRPRLRLIKTTKAWPRSIGTSKLKPHCGDWTGKFRRLRWPELDTHEEDGVVPWRPSALLSSPLLQEETLHATASHWSGPICEGANIVDLHETWVLCRSMKCQALCLSLRHSLPLNANALVVVINCSTVLMYVGPGPLESWTCVSKS